MGVVCAVGVVFVMGVVCMMGVVCNIPQHFQNHRSHSDSVHG